MKLKQFKKILSSLFPPEFGTVIDRCHNLPEIEVVVEALRVANAREMAQQSEYARFETDTLVNLAVLEAKVSLLEKRPGPATCPTTASKEAIEEVFLTGANRDANGNINKIGIIKAIREVSNMFLRDAKDLMEDVVDKGLRRSVFKGPKAKAEAAVRTLAEYGGISERKEVF